MNQEMELRQRQELERAAVPVISPDIIRPRLPEVGRIRLGERKVTSGGKQYPAKLETFRFTSRDKGLIEIVAERYGGTVAPWASDEGPQWQVYSEASSIDVVVPKAELAFSQWFENWDGAVCRRRCDGHREIIGDRPCVCDPAARDCLPTTRLNVLLPDVPGMGVWRVESHGFNAAAEILGTIELAAASGASLLPATLTLAQRSKRRLDPKNPAKVITNRFVVPVLSIKASLREMVAEQEQIRRRTLGLLPMAELADDTRMVALRTAVFTRWPRSVEEPERSVRLAQLSRLLGREVATISAEHDLTTQEAILLTNAVNELPEESRGLTAAADDETPERAIRRLGDERRAGDPWVQETEGAGGAVGGSGDPDDDPAGAPWPPDLPVGGEADAVRPASGAERHGEPRQETSVTDGRSEARKALEDVRDACKKAQRSAAAISTVMEYVSKQEALKSFPTEIAVKKFTDEQCLELADLLERRCLSNKS